MDENNQYGNAMTKPLPKGSIKKSKNILSLRKFNLIVEGISDENKTGNLLVVEMEFDEKKSN